MRAEAALCAAMALAGRQSASMPPDPTGRADADMRRVLAAFQASGAKPIAGLTVEQARAQLTPGDAAVALTLVLGVTVPDVLCASALATGRRRLHTARRTHVATPKRALGAQESAR